MDGCFSLCFGFRLGLILGFGLQGVESEAKVATTNPLSPGFNEAATSTWPSEDNLFTSFSDQSTHAEETAAREAALALPEEAAASVLFEEVPLEASLLPEPLFSGLGVARPKETADALRSSMLKVLFFTGVATISMPDVEEISSGFILLLVVLGILAARSWPQVGRLRTDRLRLSRRLNQGFLRSILIMLASRVRRGSTARPRRSPNGQHIAALKSCYYLPQCRICLGTRRHAFFDVPACADGVHDRG